MAQMVLGAAGAIIGGIYGGPAGAQLGWAIGSAIGGIVDPPKGPTVEGPKLGDLKTQTAEFGTILPRLYGTVRVTGNAVWNAPLKEIRHKDEVGGGKGGAPATTQISYSYNANVAIGLCSGPIVGIRRIWANGELIFSASESASAGSILSSGKAAGNFRVYLGDEDQEEDPTIVSFEGLDETPTFRGLAYVLFHDFDVTEKYGNRAPNFEFEVVADTDKGEVNFRSLVRLDETDTVIEFPDGDLARTGYRNFGNNLGNSWRIAQGGTSILCVRQGYWQESSSADNPNIVNSDQTMVLDSKMQRLSQEGGSSYFPNLFVQGLGSPDITYAPILMLGGVPIWAARTQIRLDNGRLKPGHYFLGSVSGVDKGQVIEVVFGSNLSDVITSDVFIAGCVGDPDGLYAVFFGCDYSTDPAKNPYSAMNASNPIVDRYWKVSLAGGRLALIDSGTFEVPVDWKMLGYGSYGMTLSAGGQNSQGATGCLEDDGLHFWSLGMSAGSSMSFHCLIRVYEIGEDSVIKQVYISRKGNFVDSDVTRITCSEDFYGSSMVSLYAKNGSCQFVNFQRAFTPNSGAPKLETWTRNDALLQGRIQLSELVTRELENVGFTEDQLDVSELSDMVAGYSVANRPPARGALEPLAIAFNFDTVESDAKLKFPKRGAEPILSIDEDMCGAGEGDPNEMGDAITLTRAQELELSREVSVQYMDSSSDYRLGAQYERRLTTQSVNDTSYQIPVVLTADEAKTIAARQLYGSWTGREFFEFSTSMELVQYEPSDVVRISKGDLQWVARITNKSEGANGVIAWKAMSEAQDLWSQTFTGVPLPSTTGENVAWSGPTFFRAFNAPPLIDSNDDVGHYAIATGYMPKWPGGMVYKSYDGSSFSFVDAGVFDRSYEATAGTALTKLGDFTGGNSFDLVNSFIIRILGDGSLASVTDEEVVAGMNTAYLGGELIGFANADLIDTGKYRVSRLLRGRKETGRFISTHAQSDLFVLLNFTVKRFQDQIGNVGKDVQFKSLTSGQSMEDGFVSNFNNDGSGIKPLPPYDPISILLAVGGDHVMTWTRQARIGAQMVSGTGVPLDEPTENYEIVFYKDAARTTEIAVRPSLSQDFVYTTAMQIEDFGSAQSTLYATVFQISSRIGRGWPANFTQV